MTTSINYVQHKFYQLATISNINSAGSGTALPTVSTYAVAGNYSYLGQNWDMNQEGLYRWFNADGSCFNKIIFKDTVGGSDLYKVLSGIAFNHVHGIDDNGVAYQTMSNNGRYRKWRAQCGYIAGMCNWLMPQLGFTSRIINVATNETPLTGFDDGHVVFETQHSGVWRMWDITNGCYFTDSSGVHMSAASFMAQIAGGGAFPTLVQLDTDLKFSCQSAGSCDLDIYGELFHGTSAQEEAWYRRIFQKIV